MERIKTDAGTQFTSKGFQEGLSVHEVWIELEALYHHKINDQVKVTQRTLRTIAHSIMVHAWVSDK